MDRRSFLGFVTATSAGLYLKSVGLIELSRKLVLELSGSCSFCGKRVEEVFGLAGLRQGGPVRICDECIGLCLDIIGEEERAAKTAPPEQVRRELEERERRELEAMLEAEVDAYQSKRRHPRIQLACSFCDKSQKEVAKLIAGPSVFICDGCIGDASGLFATVRV